MTRPAARLVSFATLAVTSLLFAASPARADDPRPPRLSDGGRQPPPLAVKTDPGPVAETALGKGIVIRDPEDRASLNLRFRIQTLAAVETQEQDFDTGDRGDVLTSAQVRRARLLLQGHALDKSLRYYVQFGFSRLDQEQDLLVPVRDAFLEWRELRDFRLRFGQGKVPFSRERVMSSSALELVDRSNVNAELNLDRDVGLTAFSHDLLGAGDRLRYSVGLFAGDGRNRVSGVGGFLWVARFEALPMGDFDDYVGLDLKRATKPKLSLGVATAGNQKTTRAQSTLGTTFESGTVDYRHATADAMFKWRGFSAMGAVLLRRADRTAVGTVADDDGVLEVERPRSAWGFMGSLSATLVPKLVATARYGEIRPFDDLGPLVRDREIGGGLGWFVSGHDLKIQADYFRLLADREDGVGTRDRVRVQAQLFY